jgi:hypothetical protein
MFVLIWVLLIFRRAALAREERKNDIPKVVTVLPRHENTK